VCVYEERESERERERESECVVQATITTNYPMKEMKY